MTNTQKDDKMTVDKWISENKKALEHLKSDDHTYNFSDPNIAAQVHNAPSSSRVFLSW